MGGCAANSHHSKNTIIHGKRDIEVQVNYIKRPVQIQSPSHRPFIIHRSSIPSGMKDQLESHDHDQRENTLDNNSPLYTIRSPVNHKSISILKEKTYRIKRSNSAPIINNTNSAAFKLIPIKCSNNSDNNVTKKIDRSNSHVSSMSTNRNKISLPYYQNRKMLWVPPQRRFSPPKPPAPSDLKKLKKLGISRGMFVQPVNPDSNSTNLFPFVVRKKIKEKEISDSDKYKRLMVDVYNNHKPRAVILLNGKFNAMKM